MGPDHLPGGARQSTIATRELNYAARRPAHAGRDRLERTPLSLFLTDPFELARGLAEAFVTGPWREDDLVARGARALGRERRWLRPLAGRLVAAFGDRPRPVARRVAAFLEEDRGFRRACGRSDLTLGGGKWPAPEMWPAPGRPASWDVPPITTPGMLAEFLGLEIGELEGFADLQGRAPRTAPGPLRHYRYAWRPKASGPARLIEAPKPRLKAVQRRILDEVLARVTPHEAAHGFRAGRSIGTFAGPHVGRRVVLKMDLKDFFPAVGSARVVALFLAAGYPEPVARLLAGLCTNRVPREVWGGPGAPAGHGPDVWRARCLYARPHLPQGSPTSPALANLIAYRLDARLSGLAASAGAGYTRYADDLAFSGGVGLERSARRFAVHVGAAAIEEGFEVNARKTRVMRRGVRQRVAGVVINDRPNVARDEFDRLKATLHNCRTLGPSAQNRSEHPDFRAHLRGRVAHVGMLNPERGRKLRAIFDAIAW